MYEEINVQLKHSERKCKKLAIYSVLLNAVFGYVGGQSLGLQLFLLWPFSFGMSVSLCRH